MKHESETYVVADIPGLVPGASSGKGLGHRFLRHVSRAAVLAFLVDLAAIDRDPMADVEVLTHELAAFDPELATRPSIIIATKADVALERVDEAREMFPDCVVISAVTGEGLDQLLRVLSTMVTDARATAPRRQGYVRHVVQHEPTTISREDGGWRVAGRRVERMVATTDMNNEEAVVRLQRRLISLGVERELSSAGARAGDEVRIGDIRFDFQPEGDDREPA